MKKLIILDYCLDSTEIYHLDNSDDNKDIEDLVIKFGHKPKNCSYMVSSGPITIN